jgi:hypothetical protein
MCHETRDFCPASYRGAPVRSQGSICMTFLDRLEQGRSFFRTVRLPCQCHSTIASFSPMYHLGDGQRSRQRPQFHWDIVSSYRKISEKIYISTLGWVVCVLQADLLYLNDVCTSWKCNIRTYVTQERTRILNYRTLPWKPGVLSSGVKRPELAAHFNLPLVPRLRTHGAVPPLHPIHLHCLVVKTTLIHTAVRL